MFEQPKKMKDFLTTVSKMYNISYSNILLLKSQRENISFVVDRTTLEENKFNIKDSEKPLQLIRRIIESGEARFEIKEVFDISQTDAIRQQEEQISKDEIEIILSGICSRRGIVFTPNNPIVNLENIITNIKDNSRQSNSTAYNVDEYARQTQIEINASVFAVAKKLKINTRNYDIESICKWGIDRDLKTLKESLKYIQKFTNYFIKDFQKQEKLQNIEHRRQEDEEFE